MENCIPNTENHEHKHKAHHVDTQADIASAKLAWEAWKSNDPQQIDHALDERNRLLTEDPKAWKKAMKEIDEEERLAAARAEIQREAQAEQAAAPQSNPPSNDVASPAPPQAAAMPTETLAQPADMPPGAVTQAYSPEGTTTITQTYPSDSAVTLPQNDSGASIQSNPSDGFAPPPPDTPAYNAAYGQAPPRFYGIDIGIVKLGVNSHGSIDGGFNIGILRGEGQVGLENRGDVEIFPGVKSLHARAGAGIGVNRDGFHGEAGAGANVFNLVGGDLDVGARLGNNTGVDGDFRGKAVVVEGQGAAGLSLDQHGLGVHGGGNGDILQTVGARGGGRFNLGPEHTGGAAGVGVDVAGSTLDFGPSVDAYSDGTVAQGIHLDPGQTQQPTFFPTGNRQIDPQQ
jgi:hypothetical protein